MRRIDPRWTDLSLGWQTVQALQARLEAEFGRAVQVGFNRKYRRDQAEWQKKRRAVIAGAVLFPLSVIALCLAAFYFREAACVLAWWTMTVMIIFVTLIVAGWNYLREALSDQPKAQRARVAVSLADLWWQSLTPPNSGIEKYGDRGEIDFLDQLERALPDSWLAVRGLLTSAHVISDTDVLLFGPSGLWIFEVKYWSGRIVKKDGVWRQVHRQREEVTHAQAPDEQWLRQRDEILKTIEMRLPHLAWTAGLLQGGVVFSHPKAELVKTNIEGNTASYGPAGAWVERLRQSRPDERFTLEVQLEILDALVIWARRNERQAVEYLSSKNQAEKLYEEAAEQLRGYITKMVE
jgi:hypothetical protein